MRRKFERALLNSEKSGAEHHFVCDPSGRPLALMRLSPQDTGAVNIDIFTACPDLVQFKIHSLVGEYSDAFYNAKYNFKASNNGDARADDDNNDNDDGDGDDDCQPLKDK